MPPAVLHVRQAEPGHAREPEHVGLEHDPLVLFVGVQDRAAAKCQPRVVDEDVRAGQAGSDASADKQLAAL